MRRKASLITNTPDSTTFVEPEVAKLLNQQIGNEMYSAYVYMAMAAFLHSVGLDGFATWMEIQSKEELKHAQKIENFLVEAGSDVILPAIESPRVDYSDHVDVAVQALEHEKKITQDWYEITDLVRQSGNIATLNLCQWFLNEQIDEEDKAVKLVQRAKLSGYDGSGVLLFDQELGKRED